MLSEAMLAGQDGQFAIFLNTVGSISRGLQQQAFGNRIFLGAVVFDLHRSQKLRQLDAALSSRGPVATSTLPNLIGG